MPTNDDRESAPSATAIDAATLTARQCARAAHNASDALENARAADKPKHARAWRINAFSNLQEARALARKAMLQLAAAPNLDLDGEQAGTTPAELVDVLRELEVFATREATLTGTDAVKRACAHLIIRFGGAR